MWSEPGEASNVTTLVLCCYLLPKVCSPLYVPDVLSERFSGAYPLLLWATFELSLVSFRFNWLHLYFCDLNYLTLPLGTTSSQSQKPETQGYNPTPSRDKMWICSIDNESEASGLKECLLDLFNITLDVESASRNSVCYSAAMVQLQTLSRDDNNWRVASLISSLSDKSSLNCLKLQE